MKKGPIVTIGGNVPLSPEDAILLEIVQLANDIAKGKPTIAIIPTASQTTHETGEAYSKLFKKLGGKPVVLNPEFRDSANHHDLIEIVEKSHAFFFTGGNQLRITTMLGGTNLLKSIRKKHEEGALIAGTSAGAACLTGTMIAGGESENALITGELELSHGLNFIENAVIDTHFTTRGRFPRLIHVVAENPGVLGIGIGECTGAIWDLNKKKFDVIGSRNLVVVDGVTITASNKADLKPGEPLCVENITIHILTKGSSYDLGSRKATLPPVVIDKADVEI